MTEGPVDRIDSLPPTLTATALAEELAEYEAALAAVHFEGSFDEVMSFEPFESQPVDSEPVSSRATLPYPLPTPAASGAFVIGYTSHRDVAKAVQLLEDEIEEEVPPTMRSPSSGNVTVNERPVRVTMDETPTSSRASQEFPAVKVA
ncbi:MAG TPA: hypothetical protein VNO21_03610 [Polyangiaceae bacterium]|nr:hypothetical protein [Polyangiaceae bacterium]